MKERIRVLLAEDHTMIRSAIRALLEAEADIQVIDEAVDGVEAVSKALALHPDVILMDLMMPRKTGVEAITEILVNQPKARILVLTSSSEEKDVLTALKAGATGYLLKTGSIEELVQAIRDVHHGESSLHPAIARQLLRELNRPAALHPGNDQLTERETEVLVSVAHGYANQAIANSLFISERTVRTHVSNILGKLHLANRTQAALYALHEGLITLKDAPAQRLGRSA